MPPDFNRDGSFNSENPESRRYRYVSGLVSYRRNFPGIGPKLLAERMIGGQKWPEMKEMFNPSDIAQWLTVESSDGWGFVRCSNSAAEAIRAATRERDAFKRARMPQDRITSPPTAQEPDNRLDRLTEEALEEMGW